MAEPPTAFGFRGRFLGKCARLGSGSRYFLDFYEFEAELA